jgi:hypothetical protein
MSAVLTDPVGDVAERLRLQSAGAPLRLSTLLDEAGSVQHLEVLRDAGEAHVEGRGQLRDRRFTQGEAGEDRPSSGIGEGRERRAQWIWIHTRISLIS